MKLFQVVLHRVRIAVLEASSETELESMPSEDLWDRIDSQASRGSGTLLRELTDTTEVADATTVCPHCLSPIRFEMDVSVSGVVGEDVNFSDPKKIRALCVANPEHTIPPNQVEIIVRGMTDHRTSAEAETPS